jgi:hypothetical protein
VNICACKCWWLSVVQWPTSYRFSVATVASSLCCQMLNSSASRSSQFPLFILLQVVFLPSPGHYSHKPRVILHAYYVCIPSEHVVFHVLWVTNNFVSYLHFFLMTSLLSWVVWRTLQITNKNIPGHSQSQCPLKLGLLIKNAELLPFSSYHILSTG